MEQVLDLQALLAPIPGDKPAGEDMSSSTEFDEIKEARRADEDLPQGDWETELKSAEWPKVKRGATELLSRKTKDLQVSAWLTEAITNLHGFAGLRAGLTLTRDLISNYWDSVYPLMEDGVAVRSSKIAWINANLPTVVANVPLCAPEAGGFGLRRWNEAKEVDNVARRDPAAARRLIDEEKKVSSDTIDKAVKATPDQFFRSLYEDVNACREALRSLEEAVDAKLTENGPSLSGLRTVLDQCVQVVTKTAKDRGILTIEVSGAEGVDVSQRGTGSDAGPAGVPGSRQEALRKLAEAAHYFRTYEPHSPVAYLVDRAAKWGSMSFDRWLGEVVKDRTQLDALYELLGIKPDEST